ncbi:MAG: PAS domain S-box protein [Promethearchaeota archaeon]
MKNLKNFNLEFKESRYKSPPIHLIVDKNGIIIEANLNDKKLLGLNEKDLKRHNFGQILKILNKEELIPIFAERLKKVFSGYLIKPFKVKVKENDKNSWLIVTDSLIRIKDTNFVLVTIQDITEKKIIENKLKQSEQYFRLMFENANDLIRVLNESLDIEYLNEQAHYKFLGYKKEDLYGRKAITLMHPEESKDMLRFLKDIILRGEGVREGRIKHKNGNWIWFEIKGKKFSNDKGQLKYLLISRDISERKKIEEDLINLNKKLEQKVIERTKELRDSEEKFRTIAEQTTIGIVILQDGKAKFINDATSKILEFPKEEILKWGKTHSKNLLYTDDKEIIVKKIQNFFIKPQSNKELKIKCRIITGGGNKKWIDMTLKYLNYRGQLTTLITLVDITDLKETEAKLKESQEILKRQNIELKELDKLKNDFITIAAHELKTPLVPITGYTELILMKYKNLDKELEQDLIKIQKNAEKLMRYINKLIEVMKIDANEIELDKKEIDIVEIIENIISELEIKIKNKNLKIYKNLNVNVKLWGDYVKISEVIENLLLNAIKFTPYGGSIEINAYNDKKDIIFKIKDSGIGIEKKDMQNLFKKFKTIKGISEQYSEIDKGTGLGLYISKGIIEAHGGKIWANSEGRNKGAEFFFKIPLHP